MTTVLLVGYRRSGTTALERQLCLHPDVHRFDGGVLPDGRRREECHLFDLLDAAPDEYAALIRHHTGQPPTGDIATDVEAVLARRARPVAVVRSTRLMMRPAAWARAKEWAARSGRAVHLLAISRFPLDSLSSDNGLFAATAIPDERTRSVHTAQAVWAETYARFLEDAGWAAGRFHVRLEDLVADPAATTRRITDFLGIAPFPALLDWQATNRDRWQDDPAFAGFTPDPAFARVAGALGHAGPFIPRR